jgi:hypothetical protein
VVHSPFDFAASINGDTERILTTITQHSMESVQLVDIVVRVVD